MFKDKFHATKELILAGHPGSLCTCKTVK